MACHSRRFATHVRSRPALGAPHSSRPLTTRGRVHAARLVGLARASVAILCAHRQHDRGTAQHSVAATRHGWPRAHHAWAADDDSSSCAASDRPQRARRAQRHHARCEWQGPNGCPGFGATGRRSPSTSRQCYNRDLSSSAHAAAGPGLCFSLYADGGPRSSRCGRLCSGCRCAHRARACRHEWHLTWRSRFCRCRCVRFLRQLKLAYRRTSAHAGRYHRRVVRRHLGLASTRGLTRRECVRRERGFKHGVTSWLLQRGLQHTECL